MLLEPDPGFYFWEAQPKKCVSVQRCVATALFLRTKPHCLLVGAGPDKAYIRPTGRSAQRATSEYAAGERAPEYTTARQKPAVE